MWVRAWYHFQDLRVPRLNQRQRTHYLACGHGQPWLHDLRSVRVKVRIEVRIEFRIEVRIVLNLWPGGICMSLLTSSDDVLQSNPILDDFWMTYNLVVSQR